MSSSKARSLRDRMSIDPDAPEPVTRPRRPRPAPEPAAAAVEPVPVPPDPVVAPTGPGPIPSDTEQARSTVAPAEPAPVPPDTSSTADTPPASTPRTAAGAPAPGHTPSPRSTSTPRSSSKRPTRRKTRGELGWTTALDDPAVSTGGNGYRSFYVSDEVFARFRAAIYWTARRPDVSDVPDNMSAGIEDYMDQVASDLERRFNGRDVFPPTPEQVKSHRRREDGGR